jgi:glycine dehydrogenase subunit 1
MSFTPHTDLDREHMLARIGSKRLEDLFPDVPSGLQFPKLALPRARSELEVERELREVSDRVAGAVRRPGFLGAGAARHYVPSTVDAVLRRGELFSAYTPYQPELSQGALQAMFEYQTMMCELMGMDVSTASHYDGASALAEAASMALTVTRRPKLVVSPNLDPRCLEVLRTYLANADAEITLGSSPDAETAACIVQSPNYFGQLESVPELAEPAHASGALLIVVPDPVALGLFRSPGAEGADLVAADGVGLGIPPGFGGPHLGIFAARQAHLRRVPGRLVGETVDAEGERGYVLTLGTREQHIRREKATSNICTNAALMALAAAVHLATLGPDGLRRVARLCYHKSHYAASQIAALDGYRVNPQAPDRPFFKEFVVELPCAAAEASRAIEEQMGASGGRPLALDFEGEEMEQRLLLAVTELHTKDDIDELVDVLRRLR